MEEAVVPFDIARMFVGEHTLFFVAEIIARSAIMYIATLAAIRLIGKRGMGEMSAFEFIVVIVLGSAAGDAMFYDDVPLLHALTVLVTVIAIERGINWYTNNSKKGEKRIEGSPTLLISDGKVILDAIKSEGISMNEICMELRNERVRYIEQVEKMYLEPSGRMSVFIYEKSQQLSENKTSTFPSKTA